MLPPTLIPTRYSLGEDEPRHPLSGRKAQSMLTGRQRGFFLFAAGGTYDVSVARGANLILRCALEAESLALELLLRMAAVQPLFGFACSSAERQSRNQIRVQLGANDIQAWVGRDLAKYLPGLYWLTLIPQKLAERHNIPLASLQGMAREFFALDGGQHLFRFYDHAENWREVAWITDFCAKTPRVFNVEAVKREMSAATNFLEVSGLVARWR